MLPTDNILSFYININQWIIKNICVFDFFVFVQSKKLTSIVTTKEFNQTQRADAYKYGMHKASYKLSLKLINTTKRKKWCIHGSINHIYIMQLLTKEVTKIQSFWREPKYQRYSGNARLYLHKSKRERSIFEKINCLSFVKTLIKRGKKWTNMHMLQNCIKVSTCKEHYDLHALQSVVLSVPTTK